MKILNILIDSFEANLPFRDIGLLRTISELNPHEEGNVRRRQNRWARGSTLALKPRADVNKSKTGYQWPREKGLISSKHFLFKRKKEKALVIFKFGLKQQILKKC